MDASAPGSLEDQLAELRSRVHRLEDTLHRQGIALWRPEPAGVVPPSPPPPRSPAGLYPAEAAQAVEPGPALPPSVTGTPPLFASAASVAATPDHSLESRIGSQWFNRIGILAVLIAMAWFLKLAIDNHWIGPLGRVLIGLLAGAGCIVWSERFQRRGYTTFAYSLKAVGSGILYLSLWAAFSLFQLVPAGVAFAAMIAITAFNGYMSWLQDAELLALYSIVGGLSTPLLLSTGANHEITLFSYLLLLDCAILILVLLRPWSRILFGAFTGTVLFFATWWFRYYSEAFFAPTFFFLLCFFLLFAFATRLINVGPDTSHKRFAWDNLALVLMPIANAALSFLAFYALFNRSIEATDSSWAGAWIAVAFAAFYLFLNRLPARGRLKDNSSFSAALNLTTAVVFLTVAIPLKARGRWLTLGWLVQGTTLLRLARRTHLALLRTLAGLCLALGLMALIVVHSPASTTPILNERFAADIIAVALFAYITRLAHSTSVDDNAGETLPWPSIAAVAALLVNALILLAVSREIHNYWWYVRWQGGWELLHEYRMYAQFTYSAFFMLFGAILLCLGFWRDSAFVRWQALLLLAITIGKVFVIDVSQLSQGYRILSFLGLGVLLLGVSFVYQRDLLHLRYADTSKSAGGPEDLKRGAS